MEQSFLCATRHPDLKHILKYCMKISLTLIELRHKQECLEKINQRGITWQLRKGEQLFLCATSHPNLIHIPIKLNEDIPNSYYVMDLT